MKAKRFLIFYGSVAAVALTLPTVILAADRLTGGATSRALAGIMRPVRDLVAGPQDVASESGVQTVAFKAVRP
jgi:hypothetical protein